MISNTNYNTTILRGSPLIYSKLRQAMHLKLPLLLMLGLNALLCTMQSHAAETYQRCSEQQQEQIIQKFKLLTHKFDQTDVKTYKSCINLDQQQKIQLIAISQPIAYQDYNDMEHDLNLYLIDSSSNKILQRYKDPSSHITDAERYDGVKLHTTKFSTLTNTHVVGVETGSSHEGGFSYRHNNLALFKIDSKQPIKEIFSGIGTDDSGYVNASCGQDNPSSEVKRILVLSNQLSNGLQNIVLKEQKNQIIGNENTCKVKRNTFKQQQTLKFNGKEYKLQHHNLLGIDPF